MQSPLLQVAPCPTEEVQPREAVVGPKRDMKPPPSPPLPPLCCLQVAPCPAEIVRQVQPRVEDGDMKLMLLKCTMDVALAIGVRKCGDRVCRRGTKYGDMKLLLLKCTMGIALAIGVREVAGCEGQSVGVGCWSLLPT